MSDYSWVGPAIQAGAGLIGSMQQQEGAEAQNKLLEDAYNRALAMLQSGQLSYTPEKAGAIGPSALEQADPLAKLAQRDALLKLQELGREGFGAIEKAGINRAMAEAGQQERANREAILARLQPGSGASIAARLSAQQSGANRANQAGLDIAAEAQKRRMAALGRLGDLSGQMRNQNVNEAQTLDAISKFNAETSRFNAGQANLAKGQGIQNKLGALELAGGAGGRLGAGRANLSNLQAQQTAGIGQGIAGAVNAAGERDGNGVRYDASGTPYYSNPDDWEQW